MKYSEEQLSQSLRFPQRRHAADIKPSCLDCPVREQCVPGGMEDLDCRLIDRLVERRLFLERGEHLYWMDQTASQKLYAIRTGQFKTYQLSSDGTQRVASFQIEGDVLGLDSLGKSLYQCSAVALSNSVLCEFSYARLVRAKLAGADMPQHLDRLLSKALVRELWRTLLVRDGKAAQKLAGFLWAMASHNEVHGQRVVALPMTRQDIGDYLGIVPETVSRLLGQFERSGLLVLGRHALRITNPDALRVLADGAG